MTEGRPLIRLNPGAGKRLRAGAPWVFSNELLMKPEYRQLPPGGLVRLEGDDGARLGTFMFNPHSLIAARLLDRDPEAAIDGAWVRARLADAIALRERVCDTPYHRLVHAEADFLPGLIIDRYDDVAVLQANAAGMDRLIPEIVEALVGLLNPRAIIARNDSAARRQEGLEEKISLLHGIDPTTEVLEGGVRFAVDPLLGQKTGWFFDQQMEAESSASLRDPSAVSSSRTTRWSRASISRRSSPAFSVRSHSSTAELSNQQVVGDLTDRRPGRLVVSADCQEQLMLARGQAVLRSTRGAPMLEPTQLGAQPQQAGVVRVRHLSAHAGTSNSHVLLLFYVVTRSNSP